MDNVELQMENLKITKTDDAKTDDILIKTETFVDAYKKLKELKNKNDENKEDALILIVKHKKVTAVDELKPFLDIFDPNYYSPRTTKSAFSYAVEQNDLIFAQVLLDKMSGENEKTREYFLRDLSNFDKKCTFESEIFKSACRTYHNLNSSSPDRDYNHSLDSEPFISAMVKTLVCKDGTVQEGHMSKNGKVAYQINNQDFQRKQFLRHFSTLLYYKWKKENRDLAEVQAMWVFNNQDGKAKHRIYVAVNPYKKAFDEAQRKKFQELSNTKEQEHFLKLIKDFKDNDISSPKGYNLRRYNRVKKKFDRDSKFIMDICKLMENSLKFDFVGNKNVSNHCEKHAEEILCDKAQEIIDIDPSQNQKFYIYGKKRPCLTCYSRMEVMKIHHFNRNHGKFWLHGTKLRDNNNKHIRNTDVLINTLKLLSTSTIHVTLAPNNTHHDDWDTDSDEEMLNQNSSTPIRSSTPNNRTKRNQQENTTLETPIQSSLSKNPQDSILLSDSFDNISKGDINVDDQY